MKASLLFSVVAMIYASSLAVAQGTPQGNPVFDPSAMDTTTSPCQDFYQYSCGTWLKNTQIPSDQSTWARSFSVVYDQNLQTLNDVLSSYAKGNYTPSTPYQSKLGDFYASCTDTNLVEKESPAILKTQLAQLDRFQNAAQLPKLIARLHLEGVNVLFSFSSTTDLKDPTLTTAELDQGGMGLPDSTYYKKTDAESVKLRGQYQTHIAAMFVLAGQSQTEAAASALDVLSVENALAQIALPPEDLQDPTKLYNPSDAKALGTMASHFNWNDYFQGLGIKTPAITNVSEPKFLGEVDALVNTLTVAQLRTYLKWHLIESIAPLLGQKLYTEWFNFEGKILNGEQTPPPRWKSCVSAVSGGMSEALGQAFVAKAFSPAAKARALAMIANIELAFKTDLQSLIWLDDATRTAAVAKLALLTQKIGYPDTWRNYDKLAISKLSYWHNGINARIFENQRVLNKIGGPVDPKEWGMSPQTVNAYYDPSLNQINFPAGILQAPFFSELANDANNYGAIGMVIGHEMTHGFDTTGSKFDGHGAEKDWWTAAVKTVFEQKAQCLENQYSQYVALPGLNVNGTLTITENIADQGGLKLSYAAFQLAQTQGQAIPSIAGLNGNQQFFVSMAQMWCEKQTDEALKEQVSGDPHSPAKFRVIGTMVNNPGFAAAFNCPAGTPMNPANRCSIW